MLNTYTGIRSTNQTLVNVAKTCGAGNLKIFWTVGVPSAMPMIFAGLKTSMGSAWGTIVAAEMLASFQRPWLHDPDGPLLRGRFTDHGRHHCHWNFRLCVVRIVSLVESMALKWEAQEMKTTKNPWLEERGALYKLFYYLGPCLLIIAFLLLWQGIASGGKTTLPTPAAALERLVTIWSGDIAKHPMIYHVGISMRRC